MPNDEVGELSRYDGVVGTLADQIRALVPVRPEILQLEDPWGLFRVPGFDCGALNPSLEQATWALRIVQHEQALAASPPAS
jgi:hypothetical protein